MDPKKPPAGPPGSSQKPSPEAGLAGNPTVDEFFTRLRSDMRHPSPSQESIEAARQTMERLAAEASADPNSDPSLRGSLPALVCETCGHQNRPGNQFCGMCGLPLTLRAAPESFRYPIPGLNEQSPTAPLPNGHHHYHHHYHHYVMPGQDPSFVPSSAGPVPAASNLTRPRAPGGATMNRVETAVRKVMQDWVFACNSKQLDDLVSTYSSDALVLRPNHPAVRGAPAIREFFFAALDSGVGDVEIDPLRLDVTGDVGYEAGRYKMLVPVAVSKRREEKGKYLTLLARQPNGEWRIVSDCWSSDLSLAKPSEADPKAGTPPAPPKPAPPRRI